MADPIKGKSKHLIITVFVVIIVVIIIIVIALLMKKKPPVVAQAAPAAPGNNIWQAVGNLIGGGIQSLEQKAQQKKNAQATYDSWDPQTQAAWNVQTTAQQQEDIQNALSIGVLA